MRDYKGNGFTKRHFEQLAEILRNTRVAPEHACRVMWEEMRSELINVFRADNARFDEGRFIAWTEKV